MCIYYIGGKKKMIKNANNLKLNDIIHLGNEHKVCSISSVCIFEDEIFLNLYDMQKGEIFIYHTNKNNNIVVL